LLLLLLLQSLHMLKLQLAIGSLTTQHLVLCEHTRVFHETWGQTATTLGLVLSRVLRLLS
jgi:hypothetical protein